MKNLTKKIVALASIAVLTLAMGLTAFAAGSPSVQGVKSETAGVTVGTTDVKAPAPGYYGLSSNSSVYTFVLSGNVPADGKVTVKVDGVKAGAKVVVRCLKDGKWETVTCTVNADGTITLEGVTPDSTYSVYVDSTSGDSSGKTSPKTGEASAVAVVSLVALLGCAVAFTAKKRA